MPISQGGGFLNFSFTVDGLNTMQRRFITAGKQITDMSVPFNLIGAFMRGVFVQNFGAQGVMTQGGAQWAPLAASTLAERARLGYGGLPMMVRTGALLTSLGSPGAPGNINRVSPMSATFGTTLYYAGFHQTGTRRMPARKLVGWGNPNSFQVSTVTRIIGDWLRQVIGQP